MIHRRIDVGIKTVFLLGGFVPGGWRFFVGKTDFDDTFAAFEAVLPGHHQAHWRAVLIRHHFTIHAKGQQRQRMHGFVQAQRFDVRPIQHPGAEKRHGFWIGLRDEFDVFGASQGLDFFDQFSQRITDPRNHHGPTLNAAQTVDPLLLRAEFEQVLNRIRPGLLDHSFNRYGPGFSHQRAGIFGRIGFVGAKLVEVVVSAGVFVLGDLFHRHRPSHRRFAARQSRQLAWFGCRGLRHRLAAGPARQRRARHATGHQLDQRAAPLINVLRRGLTADGVVEAVGIAFDQHVGSPQKWSR